VIPTLCKNQNYKTSEHFTDLRKINLVKFPYRHLVLDSSLCLLLPQLTQKMTLTLKMVKRDLKRIILICYSKTLCMMSFMITSRWWRLTDWCQLFPAGVAGPLEGVAGEKTLTCFDMSLPWPICRHPWPKNIFLSQCLFIAILCATMSRVTWALML